MSEQGIARAPAHKNDLIPRWITMSTPPGTSGVLAERDPSRLDVIGSRAHGWGMQGSLLVIEGNANVLRSQGHTRVVDTIEQALSTWVQQDLLRYSRVRITSGDDLRFQRAVAQAFAPKFNAILLLAHGSHMGADAAPGISMSWDEVGEALAPLAPKAILAISCMAAASGPSDSLFKTIPTLTALGGSATTLTANQAGLAALQLIPAAFGQAPDPTLSAFGTLINAADTGGLVFWRSRTSFEATGDFDRLMGDVCAIIGAELLSEGRKRPRGMPPPSWRKAPPRHRQPRPIPARSARRLG